MNNSLEREPLDLTKEEENMYLCGPPRSLPSFSIHIYIYTKSTVDRLGYVCICICASIYICVLKKWMKMKLYLIMKVGWWKEEEDDDLKMKAVVSAAAQRWKWDGGCMVALVNFN